ncbi:MAG: serine/threonine-protein kinase RsbW [Verrucomicrobiota bacterium]
MTGCSPAKAHHLQVVLKNKPEEKRKLLAVLQDFARDNHLPAKVLQAADLVLEEHLTNLMNYAYADDLSHEIIVRFEVHQGALAIEVEDDGAPFDPLLRPEVDTSVPLEEKPIGGLGIHLIRKFMDDVHYRRERGKNILTLRKALSS